MERGRPRPQQRRNDPAALILKRSTSGSTRACKEDPLRLTLGASPGRRSMVLLCPGEEAFYGNQRTWGGKRSSSRRIPFVRGARRGRALELGSDFAGFPGLEDVDGGAARVRGA